MTGVQTCALPIYLCDKYNTRYVVAQIRKKLGDDPANPRYIVNEPGVGYRLLAP